MNEKAVMPPPLVTVVVPVFNYGHLVTMTIDSIKEQTLSNFECFIVNDGSTDDTEEVVIDAIKDDKRFHYVYQDNLGVSFARNNGISRGTAPFVTCIDSDDQMASAFLATLVPHLQADNSLGLVYSGLKLLLPRDGEILELNSKWPNECDFDEQVKGHNQVPTCCMFRRECWERLGGYRQRYGGARGCGTEDAEFWLRIGAYGWGIKQVTKEPLFKYLLGGRTSGDKDYKEVNYLQWHPWAVDGQHPFASIATPLNHSHPVRYYDEPTISVVIPVGPGHETDIIDALDSLEAQSFRFWEAIVVDDTGDDKLDMTGFPFVRLIQTPGKMGAGYARNRGAEIARGQFLLFQDADDWLYPDVLWRMLEEYGASDGEVAIYGDADGLAVINAEYAKEMEKAHRLLQYRPEDGHALIRHFSADYDWARAVQQPDKNGNFYLWCNINTLIPRHWHDEVGGFDEDMESWEDWDYWIRLARLGKCFIHIREPFFVYRFYTGSRRWAAHPEHKQGLLLARNLVQYMQGKYAGGEVVARCKGCGGSRRRATVINDYPSMITQVTSSGIQTGARTSDDDFVLCEYLGQPPGNISDHSLIGVSVFPEILSGVPMIPRGDGWSIDYRYRKAGDRFLVHREDLQRSPHWFRAVELDKSNFESVLPKQRTAPPPPPPEPESLAETLEKAVQVPGMPVAPVQQSVMPTLTPTPTPTLTAPTPLPQAGGPIAEPPDEPISEEEAVKSLVAHVLTVDDIQVLPGVTKGIAEQMTADGIQSYEDILNLGVQGLQKYKGVADTRAMMIIDAINAMVLNAS